MTRKNVSNRIRIMPSGHWDWPIPTKFSQGWKIGNTVYVGGQVSQSADGVVLHPGDIEAQIQTVFENIRSVLREVGGDLEDIVKLNTYYVYDGHDTDEFYKKMTRVRMAYLADAGPAATAVRVAGLALDGLVVEIEAIAVLTEMDTKS